MLSEGDSLVLVGSVNLIIYINICKYIYRVYEAIWAWNLGCKRNEFYVDNILRELFITEEDLFSVYELV